MHNNNTTPFILTFGSCGWDRIVDAETRELIYEEEGRKNSHQAVAAKRAGADSMLVSFVGDDEIGHKCLESLQQCGVDIRFVTVVSGESTEVNTQLLDRETKDYTLERWPAELSQRYGPEMVEQYKSEILRADYVILVSKQPKDFLTEMITFCYENSIPTSLTISHKKFDIEQDRDLLKKVTVIAGNFEESGWLTHKTTLEEMLTLLPNMMITKGAEGVWFCDEHGTICHEKAVPVEEVVEANGAGDTFIGNFVVFRSEGRPLKESIHRGMCASAIEIGRMGVVNAMPLREETEALYQEKSKDFFSCN